MAPSNLGAAIAFYRRRACRCQVEFLLDGPACASHADGGVARGVRRPVKVLLALNCRSVFYFIQLYSHLWGRSLFSRYLPGKGEAENGAEGNTCMESFNGHFKGENGSLFFDARNMWELRRAIALQIEYCNAQRRHSACVRANTHRHALGYFAPWTYIKKEVTLPKPALDLAQISF